MWWEKRLTKSPAPLTCLDTRDENQRLLDVTISRVLAKRGRDTGSNRNTKAGMIPTCPTRTFL